MSTGQVERIGMFGGSFDPVHLGHLMVAEAAREELQLDRIFFIPVAQSPFKPAAPVAPAAERLRMLRLASAGQPAFEIDEQEIARGGVSYTIDTVREYKSRFPNAALFYLIGADQVQQLGQWRSANDLARLVEFIIIPRPGEEPGQLPPPFRGRMLSGFQVGISSSKIRARVRAGQNIDYVVPFGVAEVIHNNRLYL